MVEIFKTNVDSSARADRIVLEIQARFPGYRANFDLEDCDRILRIEVSDGTIMPGPVLRLLEELGHNASVLPDVVPQLRSYSLLNYSS